jgi:hypothetical protein
VDVAKCGDRILAARDAGRIGFRPDEHEIVVHHFVAAQAVTFGDKSFLEGLGVNEHHVGVAAPTHVERLAGAQGDDANLDPGLLFEVGQQMAEEPALLSRGSRGHGDVPHLRLGRKSHGER